MASWIREKIAEEVEFIGAVRAEVTESAAQKKAAAAERAGAAREAVRLDNLAKKREELASEALRRKEEMVEGLVARKTAVVEGAAKMKEDTVAGAVARKDAAVATATAVREGLTMEAMARRKQEAVEGVVAKKEAVVESATARREAFAKSIVERREAAAETWQNMTLENIQKRRQEMMEGAMISVTQRKDDLLVSVSEKKTTFSETIVSSRDGALTKVSGAGEAIRAYMPGAADDKEDSASERGETPDAEGSFWTKVAVAGGAVRAYIPGAANVQDGLAAKGDDMTAVSDCPFPPDDVYYVWYNEIGLDLDGVPLLPGVEGFRRMTLFVLEEHGRGVTSIGPEDVSGLLGPLLLAGLPNARGFSREQYFLSALVKLGLGQPLANGFVELIHPNAEAEDLLLHETGKTADESGAATHAEESRSEQSEKAAEGDVAAKEGILISF